MTSELILGAICDETQPAALALPRATKRSLDLVTSADCRPTLLDTAAKINTRSPNRAGKSEAVPIAGVVSVSGMSEPWLNTAAIAAYVGGVDVSTVQRWCIEQQMPHVRANARGRILSKASWIDSWLMKRARYVGDQKAA